MMETKQRMTALLANNIEIGEINLAAAIKQVESGKLKGFSCHKMIKDLIKYLI